MADIRINALATTATTPASDDYLALDGTAQGTRKILATNIANNVTDVILGTSGPSVKSSLSARAPRQGLVFDGTAGATVSGVAAFGTSDFTVAAWVKPTTISGNQYLFGGANGTAFALYLNSSGALRTALLNVTDNTASTGTLTAGKWAHVAYVRSSTTGTYYINGIAAGTTTDSQNYSTGTTRLAAGGTSSDSPLTGSLAPLAENRALSASEVVALYEAGAPAGADYASGGANNTSLITGANSDFSSDTGYWAKAGSASIGGNQCTLPASGGTISKSSLLTKGTKYRLSVSIVTNQTGGLYVQNYNDVGYGNITGTGTKTLEFVASGAGATTIALQNNTAGSIVIDDVTIVPIGLLLAPDAAQAGNGYVWNDQSGNLAQIVLPSSGVQWALPSVAGQRIRGTTSTNGNQQLLGASVLLPAECQITHVRARARSGTPTITIGTASGGAQIVASVALSTTWLNCTIALTGGIVSSADDIWIGSNSTDVVETDIAFQPLDF